MLLCRKVMAHGRCLFLLASRQWNTTPYCNRYIFTSLPCSCAWAEPGNEARHIHVTKLCICTDSVSECTYTHHHVVFVSTSRQWQTRLRKKITTLLLQRKKTSMLFCLSNKSWQYQEKLFSKLFLLKLELAGSLTSRLLPGLSVGSIMYVHHLLPRVSLQLLVSRICDWKLTRSQASCRGNWIIVL